MNEAVIGYYRLTDAMSVFEVVLSMLENEKDACSFENAEAIYEVLQTVHSNMMNARGHLKNGMDEAGIWEE
ncbi:MAG: hypothetical protein IJD66_00880 [Methanocorpusculum sp.]|nr:hypothetical protein [Methanocorpusculum sp.]